MHHICPNCKHDCREHECKLILHESLDPVMYEDLPPNDIVLCECGRWYLIGPDMHIAS